MEATTPKLGSFLAFALRLGFVGFGGGWVIAQRMRRMLVDERRWIVHAGFVEALAVASSLPGTTTANLFTLIGYRVAGIRGALAAVALFLAPSVTIMIAFGAAYD